MLLPPRPSSSSGRPHEGGARALSTRRRTGRFRSVRALGALLVNTSCDTAAAAPKQLPCSVHVALYSSPCWSPARMFVSVELSRPTRRHWLQYSVTLGRWHIGALFPTCTSAA